MQQSDVTDLDRKPLDAAMAPSHAKNHAKIHAKAAADPLARDLIERIRQLQ